MAPPPSRTVQKHDLVLLTGKHLSPIIARGLVTRALADAKAFGEEIPRAALPKVTEGLERGLRAFLEGPAYAAAVRELRAVHERALPTPQVVDIATEGDVQSARAAARVMCGSLSASSLVTQRICTIVSELARNILLYASGQGNVEIVPVEGMRRAIVVRATDRGPGITSLADVLAGRYKSKTGLGRGVIGVKRLSDRFDIATGPTGTRIEAETWL